MELLRLCGINNLVAVSDNPVFCLDYKLPTTLTLYPLRRTADFPKSANKDTLSVHNIPFESH